MSYPDILVSQDEKDHWENLSHDERSQFESHADFLWRNGYFPDIPSRKLAMRIAWQQRKRD